MVAGLGVLAALLAARAVAAQDGPPPAASSARADAAAPLPWTRVEDARQALSARDGQGTVVVHDGEGWTIVTEPLAAARWTFTPPGHEAHPATVRRTIQRTAEGRTEVRTDLLCEGPVDACERLRSRFERLDERIRQATRGRHAPSALP